MSVNTKVQPKPKARRRSARPDDVIAVYRGPAWNEGHCRIGRCDAVIAARDYNACRELLARHREEVRH